MCFSASASFAASAIIGGTGAAGLALVRDRRQMLFAALPLGFAVHQALEGVIWQQLEAAGGGPIRTPAVEAWLFFAWFLLPIWVPAAVWRCEPDAERRRAIVAIGVLGAAIGLYLLVSSLVDAAGVTINHHHLEYQLPFHPGGLLAVPYVVATCFPLLVSSQRFLNAFGVALIISMASSTLFAARELSSVWCYFAAFLSLMLVAHFALEHRRWSRVVAPT